MSSASFRANHFQIAFTLVNLGRSLIEELELQFGADGPIEINSCCHGVSIVAFYGALSPAELFKTMPYIAGFRRR